MEHVKSHRRPLYNSQIRETKPSAHLQSWTKYIRTALIVLLLSIDSPVSPVIMLFRTKDVLLYCQLSVLGVKGGRIGVMEVENQWNRPYSLERGLVPNILSKIEDLP